MQTNEAFGMLLFLSIFELIGGAAFGVALRKLLRRDLSGMFFLIWGGGFAGIPLIIGAATFLSSGQPAYFYAQLFILLGAIITVMLLPGDFMLTDAASNPIEITAIIGAALAMFGSVILLLTLREGLGIGLILGACLAFLGAALLIGTAIRVLRSL